MTTFGPEPDVRAMNARYDGYCAAPKCGARILRGHLLYRVQRQTVTLCHVCGRKYVEDNDPRKG
jgi:hypothetical protein